MRTMLVLITVLLLLAACTPKIEQKEVLVEKPALKYDIVDVDLIEIMNKENITSEELSVLGVRLGDSRNDVISKLGAPSDFTLFEGEDLKIENLEYNFDEDSAALIFHLQNDTVERITVRETFNDMLSGDSVIGKETGDIYLLLGSADSKEIMSSKFILLQYKSEGVEFITFRGDEIGFSLVPPGDVNRVFNSNDSEMFYIPYANEIVFN